jgi:hypothetical protein
MKRQLSKIGFTSIVAIAIAAPVQAQRGAGTMRPAEGRGVQAADSGPRPQAFSVSLVLGEMQASGAADTVPAAARKALTDVKDFLPYKAYRLLDSQWTLCCGRASMVSTPIVTRLRGPEEQDYNVEIVPSNAGNGKYYVHFSLWEPRASEGAEARGAATTASVAASDAQRAELERQLQELRKTESENHPDVAQTRSKIDALERSLGEMRRAESTRRILVASAARRPIIDTSFTMDIGETVVVGTSRLKGDKALIALLTAVAATKSTTK